MLRLASAIVFSLLTPAAALSQDLPVGTEWKLYRSGLAARTSTVQRVKAPTLRFEMGRVTGTTDCMSTFSAPVSQQGSALRLGPLTVRQNLCEISAQGVLERRFLEALGKVKRFGVTDDFLVLYTTDRYTYTFRQVK